MAEPITGSAIFALLIADLRGMLRHKALFVPTVRDLLLIIGKCHISSGSGALPLAPRRALTPGYFSQKKLGADCCRLQRHALQESGFVLES